MVLFYQARMDRIENGTEQIVLPENLEEHRRDYFVVANDLKNILVNVSIKLKGNEQKIGIYFLSKTFIIACPIFISQKN